MIAIVVADPISRNSCVIYYGVVVYHYSFRWQKDICIHVWLCNMLTQEVTILGKGEREREREGEREICQSTLVLSNSKFLLRG